jgi:transposase
MAKRQLQLTQTEIGQLVLAEQQTNDRQARTRYLATRLYGQGWPIKTVQEVTQASTSGIRLWAMLYRAHGLEGLRSHWTGQNAAKLSREQRTSLKERLHHSRPVDLHISQAQFWTVSDLRIMVTRWFGVTYQDESSYQRLFQQCDFSYQQSAKVYRHRPSQVEIAAFESDLEKK